ncbi:hemolysin family protein [Candidatus Nitrosacidococcus sp. I8]|uniref:hemolysin family protein n=1 Tax=Candidatus Nitrosacidococcus sp. I8 TaxID=2942908 RepID=UPI00222668C7|nr:hemolysin family protein [Candidatus Nitrosacidococcus sp. I8]CAH9019663.1 hypothetical protein NURINAE_01675 [Candidatus Nitrosacidococcus sp. I8]
MNLTVFVIFFLLIAINALYVAAEFAIVGVRRSQIIHLAEKGTQLAKELLPIVKNPEHLDRYIAASQVGITLSSLILGAYSQATVGKDFANLLIKFSIDPLAAQSVSAITILILLTGLQVVLGELLPKSLALQYPVQFALYTYIPMHWSLKTYGAFITLLNNSGVILLRFLGFKYLRQQHIHSSKEIDLLITESREAGLFKLHEQQRLHQALSLSQKTARQLMIPRRFVATIDEQTPPNQLCQLVTQSPFSSLPVHSSESDNMIGLIYIKDITAHYIAHQELPTVHRVMKPAVNVLDKITGDRLLTIMRQQSARKLIVIDEYGVMQGLVTLDDILITLTKGMRRKSKEKYSQPEYLSDGWIRLPGTLSIEEMMLWVGISWSSSQANTVAGHIISILERIPNPSERIIIEGVEVEIEELDGPIIQSILVKVLALSEKKKT